MLSILFGFMMFLQEDSVKIPPHEPEAWQKRPIVIAHRGASGVRPEHTIAAYLKGIDQGADYIEPDLVMTKDGILVARHDVFLSETTDIADHPEFAERKRTIDGITDWFVFDFTLDEIKTLTARQPYIHRGSDYDNRASIPTWQEVIDLVIGQKAGDKTVGLYVEIKSPADFEELGFNPRAELKRGLQQLAQAEIPVYLQCFELDFLSKQRDLNVPLVYLVTQEEGEKADFWTNLPDFVQTLGVDKTLLVLPDGGATPFLKEAKVRGIDVHAWTVRDDMLPVGVSSVHDEIERLIKGGVDGIFADFPGTVVSVRDKDRLLLPPF